MVKTTTEAGLWEPVTIEEDLLYQADFTARTPGPLIVAGDANAADLSRPYRTLTSGHLRDAWREAGFGLGSTFPGSTVPASSRWKLGSWYVPQWLVRIDYIFISPHWGVATAGMAQFDGVSDHRGVVAELVLTISGNTLQN